MTSKSWGLLVGSLLCAGSCLSTEGYYRYLDGGTTGAAGTGATGRAGTTGAGTAGTTGAGGRGGSVATGVAGTNGAAGTTAASRGGTTGTAGTTGTGTGGASGTVLFSDDFESGDDSKWVWSSGDAAASHTVITDGSHVYNLNSTTSKLSVAASGLTTWTNQVVQARLKILNYTGSGSSYAAAICARVSDATHFYYFAIESNGNFAIRLNNAGNTTLGGSVKSNIAVGTWYTIKLSVIGNVLTAYVDGTMVDQVSDSTLTAGGVGLSVESTNAEFDDVVVTAP